MTGKSTTSLLLVAPPLLMGCVTGEADVRLVLHDKETEEDLPDCYLVIERDCQTMAFAPLYSSHASAFAPRSGRSRR